VKVDYSDDRLRAACLSTRVARKEYGEVLAKALGRRIKQLEAADTVADLLDGVGRWHWLDADRAGQLAGSLTGNVRIITEPTGEFEKDPTASSLVVVDIVD
jgi:hypothetical protein